jgi:polyisoprenoid-binding protein YceI
MGISRKEKVLSKATFKKSSFRHFLFVLISLLPLGGFRNDQPKSAAIDVDRSSILIHVSKSGLFSFAGDNHEVRAPIASGSVNEAAKTVELRVEAAKLTVLDPSLSPAKRAQVQQEMQGPHVLDPTHYPEIRFSSTHVEQVKPNEWNVRGDLTLHGQSHPVTVHVTSSSGHYKGTTTFKQSDFGIAPISVAGGTIKVKDELKVEFDIVIR